MTEKEKRENIRAVMILNEIEVLIARNIVKPETFNQFHEQIQEVRDIILSQTFPTTQIQSPQDEGC
jgi:hypothetical protein